MPGLKRISQQSSVNNINSEYKIIAKAELDKLYKVLVDFIQIKLNSNSIQQQIINAVDLNNYNQLQKEFKYFLKQKLTAELGRSFQENEFEKLYYKELNLLVKNEENGKVLLHQAAAEGNDWTIRFLKNTGHNVNIPDNSGLTPLYDACFHKELESIDLLLAYKADPNIAGMNAESTPLYALLITDTIDESKEVNIVKKFIAEEVELNWQTNGDLFSSLQIAILHHKNSIAQEIIFSNRANLYHLDANGQSALHMVPEYRDKQEQTDEDHVMRQENDLTHAFYLYDVNLQKDYLGNNEFQTAVINGNFYMVEFMSRYDYFSKGKKSSTVQNHEGMTSAHSAVQYGRNKCLALIIRGLTQKELAIQNNYGQTALEIAEDLIQQTSVQLSAEELNEFAIQLNQFSKNLVMAESENDQLNNWRILFEKVEILRNKFNKLSLLPLTSSFIDENNPDDLVNDISVGIERLFAFEEQEPDYQAVENQAKALSEQLKTLKIPFQSVLDNFSIDLIKSRELLKQTEFLAWKENQLKLPSSFPELHNFQPVIDSNSVKYHLATSLYNEEITKYNNYINELTVYSQAVLYNSNLIPPTLNLEPTNLEQAVELYTSVAPNSWELINTYNWLKFAYQSANQALKIPAVLEQILEIAYQQKNNALLETTSQELARFYRDKSQSSHYETKNLAILNNLSTQKEKLFAHLALAGLYHEVQQMEDDKLISLNKEDLFAKESYHYSEVYKFTQGPINTNAHTILQRETGIAQNEMGTFNIQQCVVVVAYDPVSKKVVLSHFDRFSGPLTFIQQILLQFSNDVKIELYISGARDRSEANPSVNSLHPSGKEISDNNIDLVLKQIHAYQTRFEIKSLDVGDKISPEAVVFDVAAKKLIHAMPDKPDIGQDSRVAKMLLKYPKDYALPLNTEVLLPEFQVSDEGRILRFNPEEMSKLQAYQSNYAVKSDMCTEAWHNNQLRYPILNVLRNIAGKPTLIHTKLLENFQLVAPISQPQPVIDNSNDPFSSPQLDLSDFDLTFLPQNPVLPQRTAVTQNMDLSQYFSQEDFKKFAQTISGMNVDEIAALNDVNNGPSSSKKMCFSSRKKRSTTNGCGLSRDEMLEINKAVRAKAFELKKMGGGKFEIHIDSAKFLQYIHEMPPLKKTQLLKLAARARTITGKDEFAVRRLIYLEVSIKPKLRLVSSISSAYMYGSMLKDSLMGLMQGDVGPIAMNVGFLGLNAASTVALNIVDMRATQLMQLGRLELAESVMMTGPFLKRLSLLAIGWDLKQQIEAYKNGDKAAIANVIGDSLMLSIETATGTVEILEIAGFIEGLAEFTGPIGEMAGAFIFLDVQIYRAVDSVNHLDKLDHLTAWQKFREGVYAFIGIPFSKDLVEKADLVEQTKYVLQQKFNWLKNHTEIKHYFFPNIKLVAKNCHDVEVYEEDQCMITFEGPLCGSPKYREVCDTTFPDIENNQVYLLKKEHNFKLIQEPIKPVGSEFTCLPTGNEQLLTASGAYRCNAVMGLENQQVANGINYFDLGSGNDTIFTNSNATNIIRVGNGRKQFVAGSRPDYFILEGNDTIGELRGYGGSDSLDASNFKVPQAEIVFDFMKEFLIYGDKKLYIQSFEQFTGRPEKFESVVAGCHSEKIDTQGGTKETPDRILIPQRACDFNLHLRLSANTVINNEALLGNFTYAVFPARGDISVFLSSKNNSEARHDFIINSSLAKISSIENLDMPNTDVNTHATARHIRLHFLPESITNIINNITVISFDKNSSESVVNVHYQSIDKGLSALPKSLNQTQFQELMLTRLQYVDAENLNMTFNDPEDIHDLSVNLLKLNPRWSSQNDDVVDIKGASSNNSLFYLPNGIEIKFSANNVYLFYNTDSLSVAKLIKQYISVAQRYGITCFIQNTLENEVITIANTQSQVMPNDPTAIKTHLVSLGGSKLFVIKPSNDTSYSLPLPEVVIYRSGNIDYNNVDTLDLREITNLVKERFNKSCKILFVPPTAANHAGKDLILLVVVDASGSREREIMTIRLKDTTENNWYKTLHIILNVAPQKIMGTLKQLYLEPIPLEFANKYEFVSIINSDVEANTLVKLYREFNSLHYYRDRFNLILTNLLNARNTIKFPFTLLLGNFYNKTNLNSPNLDTLSIGFLGGKIINIKTDLPKIQLAADFNQTQRLFFDRYSFNLNPRQNSTQRVTTLSPINSVVRSNIDEDISTNEIPKSSRGRRSPINRFFSEPENSSNSAAATTGILQNLKVIGQIVMKYMTSTGNHAKVPFISRHKQSSDHSKIMGTQSYAGKAISKNYPLSTRVIIAPGFFNKASQVVYNGLSGISTGISSAAVEVYSHSKESNIGFTIMLKVACDLLIQSYQFALSHSLEVWNEEETQASLPSNGLNSFFMSILQGLSIGLVNSDGFWHQSAQKAIQVILKTLCVYTIFNLLVTEDSDAEEKLISLLNFLSFAVQAHAANKVTHRLLKSDFFRSSTPRETYDFTQDGIVSNASEQAKEKAILRY